MSKKQAEKKDINEIEYKGEPGRSRKVTTSGRPRNRKPKYLRVHRRPDPVMGKRKPKKPRPNKIRKEYINRGFQWKCECGNWNVEELDNCEKCGRENPKSEGEINDVRDNQSE